MVNSPSLGRITTWPNRQVVLSNTLSVMETVLSVVGFGLVLVLGLVV